MTLNHPNVKGKILEWQDELRRLTGNFSVMLSVHVQPHDTKKFDEIATIVCEETGMPIERIRTKTRKREVVVPRQLLVYFGKIYCGLSYKELGGLVGGRDHSTALVAKRSIEDLLDTNDEAVCYYVKRINKRLEERNNTHPV